MSRPIFFCHIPKTAGTTLRVALEGAFHLHEIVPDIFQMTRNKGDYPPIGLVVSTLAACRVPVRLVRGHYHYSLHEMLDNPIKIVVLREPVARTISLLKHTIANGRVPQEKILAALEEGRLPTPDNQMTRYLGGSLKGIGVDPDQRHKDLMGKPITDRQQRLAEAKRAIRNVDILGITERMDLIDEPLKSIGIEPPRERKNEAKILDLELSEKQIDVIRKHNALDIDLYDFAVKHLNVQMTGTR